MTTTDLEEIRNVEHQFIKLVCFSALDLSFSGEENDN